MLDKDKIILVVYVNISYIDIADVAEYMYKITDAITFDDSVLRLFIPIRDSETRIECINPKRISDEEYIKVSELVENAQNMLNEFLNNTKNDGK